MLLVLPCDGIDRCRPDNTGESMSISQIIKQCEVGSYSQAIEAVKRYVHNVGAKLKVCKPYAGPAGPEPTPSELSQLVSVLRRHPHVNTEPLQEFLRQDQRRLSSGIAASGLVLAQPYSKEEWNDAALKADETLNELKPKKSQAPRTSTNEERDQYCYEQKRAGKTWREIQRVVNGTPRWEPLESEQGVSQAARRYAERHNRKWPI